MIDIKILLTIILSALPVIFWLWFYFKRIFVKRKTLLTTALKGFAVFWLVLVVVKFVSLIFPNFQNRFLIFTFPTSGKELFLLYVFTFLIIAPLEEIIKFFVLKRTIFRTKEINQIIDGLQLGIVFGLGFAAAENVYKFAHLLVSAELNNLTTIFLLRFSISTLALVSYSGLMGYYLGLALFHKFYRPFLLQKALILPLFLHGLFNFLILIGAPILSVLLVAALSWLIFRWYHERRLFEIKLQKAERPISPPFLSDTQEANVYYAKKKVGFDFIKKERLFPKEKKSK